LCFICARFDAIQWHDSKLIGFSLIKHNEDRSYEFHIDLKLLIRPIPGKYEWGDKTLILRQCRIICTDIDLLGLQLCGGDIQNGICYKDATSLEKEERNKLQEFDLPQGDDPLAQLLCFKIKLIPPSGEITAFAKNFEMV
jgi:hypothetical protein